MSNDFLPFSVGGSANVVSQVDYAALTALLANGFQSGTALSNQINKVFRQSSIMAAVLGALVADVTGQNVVDDGTTATILSNLMAALMRAGYADDTGAVNVYVITLSPAPLAYYDGMCIGFSTANANTITNPTINVNGLGAVTITGPGGAALIAGQIAANAIIRGNYNSIGPRLEIPAADLTGVTKVVNGTRDLTAAAGDVAYTGFGGTPKWVTIRGYVSGVTRSNGFSNGNENSCDYGATGGSITSALLITTAGGDYQEATATFSSDTVTLSWTKTGTPTGTANVSIEAHF